MRVIVGGSVPLCEEGEEEEGCDDEEEKEAEEEEGGEEEKEEEEEVERECWLEEVPGRTCGADVLMIGDEEDKIEPLLQRDINSADERPIF